VDSDTSDLNAEHVGDFMRRHIFDFTGSVTVRRFAGGQSNPTYLLNSGSDRYVLRRKPFGVLLGGSAHAVEREFKILAALAAQTNVPVPKPLALCTDESVIGAAFYIMQHVPGRIFSDTSLPDVERSSRRAYFSTLVATLAKLHRVDFAAAGLADLMRPGNYFQRQIHRWQRQYIQDSSAGRVPAMERLIEWLWANAPSDDDNALVHGDFRFDNVVFDAVQPEIVGILDWELATVGHPLADFAHLLMCYRMPTLGVSGLLNKDLVDLGIPLEDEVVRWYCAQTGRDGISNLDYLLAFSLFRLAAIFHGIRGRLLRGTASSASAHQYAHHVEGLADLGWAQAKRGGAT
jgi:aminoglycoside phosphotransferase (APT) family kinase protein